MIVRQVLAEVLDPATAESGKLADEVVDAARAGRLDQDTGLRAFLRTNRTLQKLFWDRPELASSGVDANPHSSLPPWPVPPIDSPAELAAWLSLPSVEALDWLTLPHRRRSTSVTHYTRRTESKIDGSTRILETPRPILKRVQRNILSAIASRIPLHDAAHGFRKQRDIFSAASPHVGQAVVIKLDLRHFFGSIRFQRVRQLFVRCGYASSIATTLAQLCCVPEQVSADPGQRCPSHLPQGAPTSPALANAIAFRLDRRLRGFADHLDANYTRYADDLFFSGDESLAKRSRRWVTSVSVIAMEEGFDVHHHKTKIMPRGQRQGVLGLVVNDRAAIPRREFETLKAILHNAKGQGLESQNRDAHPFWREHLLGRIAHLSRSHPERGKRLREMLEATETR